MDNINGLTGVNFFKPENIVNWRENVKYNFETSIKIIEFTGTAIEIEANSQETPQNFGFKILFGDKESEFNFLEKFAVFKGRYKRFYFPLPITSFTLVATAASGQRKILVEDNQFDKLFRGFEKLAVIQKNGDIITDKIISAVKLVNDIELTIESDLDRELTLSNVDYITFCILCRLGKDELRVTYASDSVSETEIDLVELPLEYDISEM